MPTDDKNTQAQQTGAPMGGTAPQAVDPMAPQPTMPADTTAQVNPEPSTPAAPSAPADQTGPVVPPVGTTPDGTQTQQ